MADNKKYYYLKLKEDFFESEELRIIESMKDGYLYSNILLKLYLKSLRSDGRLMYRNVIPYTPDILATLTGHQVGTVEKALELFQSMGMIEVLENGAMYMMDIQNYIGKSSTEADRKREYYGKVKRERESIGRSEQAAAIGGPAQKAANGDKGAAKGEKAGGDAPWGGDSGDGPAASGGQAGGPGNGAGPPGYSVDFEEFWKEYPRKADKAQAYRKYCARVRDGYSPAQIAEAARRYAEACRRAGTAEKYIKHGKTFLGDGAPFAEWLPKAGLVTAPEEPVEEEDGYNPFREGE